MVLDWASCDQDSGGSHFVLGFYWRGLDYPVFLYRTPTVKLIAIRPLM